jgi:hypothetical protein
LKSSRAGSGDGFPDIILILREGIGGAGNREPEWIHPSGFQNGNEFLVTLPITVWVRSRPSLLTRGPFGTAGNEFVISHFGFSILP